MKNRMEVSQKTKNRISIWSSNPNPGNIPGQILIQKYTCTPAFIEAVVTITKTWKQLKCPLTHEWIKKIWCPNTVKYYSAIKKEYNNAICSHLNATRDYHTKCSKPERERQIPYDIAYMWNLEYGANELSTRWKQTHRHREEACDCQGQGGGEGWTGSFRLVDANYYILNDKQQGIKV